ncbi:MAG: PfkB family carbohydrate kinase [Dermatophilaceae bacterium]
MDPDWVVAALADCSEEVLLAQLEVPVAVLLAAARARPRRLVLNPAPVLDVAVLQPLLEHVDILVPNRSELGQLAGAATPITLDDVVQCAAALAFSGTLVVTLGGDGAVVIDDSGRIVEHVPAPPVQPVDTSGAGDAFCGVLVHELARPGGDLSSAVRRAVALATTSTRHEGAQVPRTFGHFDERTAG